MPCPPPGDPPNPGIELRSPALMVHSLSSEPPGKPKSAIYPIYPLPLDPPYHLPLHPNPLDCPRAKDLSSLHHTVKSHWLLNFTYSDVYVQCYALQLPQPLLPHCIQSLLLEHFEVYRALTWEEQGFPPHSLPLTGFPFILNNVNSGGTCLATNEPKLVI